MSFKRVRGEHAIGEQEALDKIKMDALELFVDFS
jgi:hypothetical protein